MKYTFFLAITATLFYLVGKNGLIALLTKIANQSTRMVHAFRRLGTAFKGKVPAQKPKSVHNGAK